MVDQEHDMLVCIKGSMLCLYMSFSKEEPVYKAGFGCCDVVSSRKINLEDGSFFGPLVRLTQKLCEHQI